MFKNWLVSQIAQTVWGSGGQYQMRAWWHSLEQNNESIIKCSWVNWTGNVIIALFRYFTETVSDLVI